MAQYEHLPLRRLEGELDRRKFGGGSTPRRESKTHGAAISEQLETVILSHKGRAPIADVDPAFIVKVRLGGPVSEDEWAKLGLTVLASDPNKTLILFADDNELQEFKRRIAAYQRDPPEGQKNPEYAGFIGAIEELAEIAPVDRIGNTLRDSGITDLVHFDEDTVYTLDVELWKLDEQKTLLFVHRVVSRVSQLGGTLVNEYRGNAATLLRITASGAALRQILELPEISEVNYPPQPDLPDLELHEFNVDTIPPVAAPPDGAIAIGIIDSGLSAAHPLLEHAVIASFGVPNNLGDSDEKGHGTPVAGIASFGDILQRLNDGQLNARFHIASARVVDALGNFDNQELVPQQMETAIRRLHDQYNCRVINVSLADRLSPISTKPSAWAAVLDDLARELDLVIVVSAGNANRNRLDELGDAVVANYPKFLDDADNRIFEPGSAINVLTIGSIAHGNGLASVDADLVGVRPITQAGEPSPFTRIGPGVGGSIKPDLVDYGGTAIYDGATQSIMKAPQRPAAGIVTLHHQYVERLFTSQSGTSFASPLVAYKAALLREAFPNATANLVRALLAISATQPPAALSRLTRFDKKDILNVLGYGVADIEHALGSDDNRVILYREDTLAVDHFAVYEVPIPEAFQTEPGARQIRVALAFDPPVRHTRLDYAGISMAFQLVRGASAQDVFEAFRKWEKKEGVPAVLAAKMKCAVEPGPQLRQKGTLQCGTFVAQQNIERYGNSYFVVVRCEGGWASNLVESQRFSVTVQLRHQAQIQLYQQITERIRIRA